jgi:inorganic triphosphatase YgiF
MAQELEMKFLIEPKHLPDLDKLTWLEPMLLRPVRTKRVVSTYYDTPQLELKQRKLAFRLRLAGDTWLQTVKGEGKLENGVFKREEVEFPLDGPQPDFDRLQDTAFANLFTGEVDPARLQPLFTTDFERTARHLRCEDGSEVELVADLGELIAGEARRTISEIELELMSGDVAAMMPLAQRLCAELPLTEGKQSKAARGYALASGNG